jgi:hypothetical protein
VGLIYDRYKPKHPAGRLLYCIAAANPVSAPQTSKNKTSPDVHRIRKVDLVNRSVVLWEILLERKLGIGFLKEFMLGSVPQKNKKVSSYKGQREIRDLTPPTKR